MSTVEDMPGFDALTDNDKQELRKFERLLRERKATALPMRELLAKHYGNAFGDELARERAAKEHVDDAVTGRLPLEDVASNIAEDLRRAREGTKR
jgi:hypothetical protein